MRHMVSYSRKILMLLVPILGCGACHLLQERKAVGENLSSATLSSAHASPSVTIAVMETSDVHANLLPYDYYKDVPVEELGFSKLATLIKRVRSEYPLNILVDNGDLLQGTPLGEIAQKNAEPGQRHVIHQAMNALHYDAASTGNHEFNFGLDFLTSTVAASGIPQISANVYKDDGDGNPENDELLFEPWVMVERQVDGIPLKIAVIGFTPPQIMVWDKLKLTGKITTKDIVGAARHYVPEARRAGADLVIAVAHSGINVFNPGPMDENASLQLAAVDGIDAVLMGHAHQQFPGGVTYQGLEGHGVDNVAGKLLGKPAVMPGFWGSHLGVIYLDLEHVEGAWKIKDSRAKLLAAKGVTSDPEIENIVKPWHEKTLAYIRADLGQTKTTLDTFLTRVEDSAALELVNAAQADYVKTALAHSEDAETPVLSAAAPFKTGFGGGLDFTNISAGPMLLKHASDLYMFPNTLVAVKINGEQLKGWLERAAENFNTIDPKKTEPQELINLNFRGYNFDVIDGVSYEIDVTQPPGRRILNLHYKGRPVTKTEPFVVATNNYRASGAGHFTSLEGSRIVVDTGMENREALIDYIRKAGTVDVPADRNWKLVRRDHLAKDVRFTTGMDLKQRLPDWLELVSEDAEKQLITVRLRQASP